LSNISQVLLEEYFANLPFEKGISVYSQNLWITLWMIPRESALMRRGVKVFVILPIFCDAPISFKNKGLL